MRGNAGAGGFAAGSKPASSEEQKLPAGCSALAAPRQPGKVAFAGKGRLS